MKRPTEWEIEYLGIMDPQYFQGRGISGTDWKDVYIGIGDTPAEAMEDALDAAAMSGWDADYMEREDWTIQAALKEDSPSASEEVRIDASNDFDRSGYDSDEDAEEAFEEWFDDYADRYPIESNYHMALFVK